jgi:hypothetical protein
MKKDPEQRRILGTEDKRRRRNQGGFWDEKPEKNPSNRGEKKAHAEPRKNPEPEAETRRQENGKITEKKKDPEPKPSGRTGIIIFFVPSFLKKTEAERRQTTERRRSRGQESKGRRRNSSFPARSVFTDLRPKQ